MRGFAGAEKAQLSPVDLRRKNWKIFDTVIMPVEALNGVIEEEAAQTTESPTKP